MKKTFKIILIVFILSSFILPLPLNRVYATDEIISGGDDFVSIGQGQTEITDSDIKGVSDTIYNILLAAATVTAVIVGAVLGVQFMNY